MKRIWMIIAMICIILVSEIPVQAESIMYDEDSQIYYENDETEIVSKQQNFVETKEKNTKKLATPTNVIWTFPNIMRVEWDLVAEAKGGYDVILVPK